MYKRALRSIGKFHFFQKKERWYFMATKSPEIPGFFQYYSEYAADLYFFIKLFVVLKSK